MAGQGRLRRFDRGPANGRNQRSAVDGPKCYAGLGPGRFVPNSLHALVGGQIVELHLPYPNEVFRQGHRWPKAGWKGCLLRETSGNRTPFHIEGIDEPAPAAPGETKDTLSSPLVVSFQLRPTRWRSDRLGGVVGRAHTSRR